MAPKKKYWQLPDLYLLLRNIFWDPDSYVQLSTKQFYLRMQLKHIKPNKYMTKIKNLPCKPTPSSEFSTSNGGTTIHPITNKCHPITPIQSETTMNDTVLNIFHTLTFF